MVEHGAEAEDEGLGFCCKVFVWLAVVFGLVWGSRPVVGVVVELCFGDVGCVFGG